MRGENKMRFCARNCNCITKSRLSIVGNTQIHINSDEEIEAMRVAGKLARECLDEGAKVCGVGVTTDEIDRAVHEGFLKKFILKEIWNSNVLF